MNSKIILAKNIKIDKNYVNVLSYTEEQMVTLCENNMVASANDYSFIRTNKTIMTAFSYEQCLQANYIAFQNKDYSNKWFFAWIDAVNYLGENNTEIVYTIDAWSTWYDKWEAKRCFVTREHVNDDTIGLHTINENLNVGDIIADSESIIEVQGQSFYWIVISSLFDPNTNLKGRGIGTYAGYPQGSMWFAWLVNINNPGDDITAIADWLNLIDEKGQVNSIESIFVLPSSAISVSEIDETTHKVKSANFIKESKTYQKAGYYNFSDYTPKNNKCYVYPYNFIRVSNNLGSYNDYMIEDFHTNYTGTEENTIVFELVGLPCQGFSGKLRPLFYKGIKQNDDESVQIGKFPTLSWASDSYINWLTQNGVNIATSAISSIGSSLSGKYGSVASGIAGLIGNFYQGSLQSNVAHGNVNMGDLSFRDSLYNFKLMRMRCKKEYLQVIDDYFSRFGYQVNITKIPNLTGRQNWNYVEIGASEYIGNGSVPLNFMETINNACRRGVTIWHVHNNIGNFNLDNSIV